VTFPTLYVRRTDEPRPLEQVYRALRPMLRHQAQARLRRRCALVVEHFLRGRSCDSLAICLGVGSDLIEDAIRWHMNKRDRLKRRARGKGRVR
jgi:hypothetical protein